jgi:hypothetical protein
MSPAMPAKQWNQAIVVVVGPSGWARHGSSRAMAQAAP